ncbi:MAG: LPS export ABC transporter periplasmic protein LptC [Bacteroidota bacterium]|jgi:hypothetical protein
MKLKLLCYILPFFLMLIFSCVNDVKEVEKIAGPKEIYPILSGKEVKIEFRDSGLVRLKMQAGTLKRYEINVKEPYYEIDSGLKIIFYDKSGAEVSTLSARRGIFYEHSKRAEVKYKVVVVNKEGKRLETEKLFWQEKDSIRNEGDAYLYENNRRLQGKKLIASSDFSHMELEQYIIQIPVEELEKEK